MPRRWLLSVLVLLAIVFSFALLAVWWQPGPQRIPTGQATVHVTGSEGEWLFSVEWPDGIVVRSVGEATVPAGISLRFLVTSADVAYAVYIPALSVKIDAIPGHVNEFVFDALLPGDYLLQNAEFAGLKGIEMTAILHVIA